MLKIQYFGKLVHLNNLFFLAKFNLSKLERSRLEKVRLDPSLILIPMNNLEHYKYVFTLKLKIEILLGIPNKPLTTFNLFIKILYVSLFL